MSTALITADGQPLPFAYQWLVHQGLTNFGPWYFIKEQRQSDVLRSEFIKETAAPNTSEVKDFQPFARHAACDDFAGFVISEGKVTGPVVLVHLTFAGRAELPGYPGMMLYEDIWAWFSACVVEDMRNVADRLEAFHAAENC
jgi:hypothetical protein